MSDHKMRDIKSLQIIDFPSDPTGQMAQFHEAALRCLNTARMSDDTQERLLASLVFLYNHIMTSPEK